MNLKDKIKGEIFQNIGLVADEQGLECYLIGGYVRDLLLGRPSKDIDVVVVGDGVEFAQKLRQKIGKDKASLSVFKTYGTAQIKTDEEEIEIVGARRESYRHDSRNPIVEAGTLRDDQLRRDFTINVLAICLNSDRFGDVIDPFGGIDDLEKKIIRTPCDPDITFSDDPLRMMRAIRFATQLGFRISEPTLEAIMRNHERIEIITKERITDELNKIILSRKPSVGFELLSLTGLLAIIFPELSQMRGVETRDGKAHKDNFKHSLQVLDQLAEKSDNLWLRWAALLHDIGKPQTKRWEEGRGWTFHNHNFVGSKMVKRIFQNLRLPLGEPLRFTQKMVNLHMRPIALMEDEVTDSAVRRLLFEAGDDIEELMMLCESDITSNNRLKVRQFAENYKLVRQKLVEIEEKDRIRQFQPPIGGEEIMQIFGLPPSAMVGTLKNEIKDAILDGVIPNSYPEAYEFLMKSAKEKGLAVVEN